MHTQSPPLANCLPPQLRGLWAPEPWTWPAGRNGGRTGTQWQAGWAIPHVLDSVIIVLFVPSSLPCAIWARMFRPVSYPVASRLRSAFCHPRFLRNLSFLPAAFLSPLLANIFSIISRGPWEERQVGACSMHLLKFQAQISLDLLLKSSIRGNVFQALSIRRKEVIWANGLSISFSWSSVGALWDFFLTYAKSWFHSSLWWFMSPSYLVMSFLNIVITEISCSI